MHVMHLFCHEATVANLELKNLARTTFRLDFKLPVWSFFIAEAWKCHVIKDSLDLFFIRLNQILKRVFSFRFFPPVPAAVARFEPSNLG
jgi:hypothetical protein